MNDIKLKTANKSPLVLIFALVLYIASAIAFECTAETARISTLAIYFLFGVGGYYILKKGIFHFNIYSTCILTFALYVFVMHFPLLLTAMPKVVQSSYHVVYVNFTCAVLCLIVYMIMYHKPELIKWILIGNIIGGFVLAYRVVNIYDSIEVMLEYASDTDLGEHRIGVEIINANLLGLYMSNAVLCVITVMMFMKNKSIFLRVCLVALIVIFAGLALLTASKKSIAFILMGIIAMVYFVSKGKSASKKTLVLFFGLCALVLIIWAIFSLDVFSSIRIRIEEMFMTFTGEKISRTDQNRARYINEGLEAFWQSPLFGNGTGYSYKLFNTYSHNNFVELLMNYGVVGFLLHYLPSLILISKLYKLTMHKDTFAIYFFVYVAILIFMGIAFVSYYERVMQLIIAAAWGYCDSATRRIKNEDQEYI